ISRNYVIFSVPRLSNADAIMKVYFAGAGAYQIEHGLTLEEAQRRISQEFHLSPPEHTNNHWIADRSVVQMDAELQGAAGPVLQKYPKALIVSSFQAIAKASVSHNVSALASLVGRRWIAPGTSELVRLQRSAFERLWQNGPLLTLSFFWQLFHNSLTWG